LCSILSGPTEVWFQTSSLQNQFCSTSQREGPWPRLNLHTNVLPIVDLVGSSRYHLVPVTCDSYCHQAVLKFTADYNCSACTKFSMYNLHITSLTNLFSEKNHQQCFLLGTQWCCYSGYNVPYCWHVSSNTVKKQYSLVY
jgi:hypothetical protein